MANGEPLPNLGEKVLKGVDKEGNELAVRYQIADVTQPLNSISEICDTGARVVFGSGGGFVYHLKDGGVTPFRRSGKLYELDHWIRKPSEKPSAHEVGVFNGRGSRAIR